MRIKISRSIAHAPLFEPLRELLLGFDHLPAGVSALNAASELAGRPPVSGAGMPIRFVSVAGDERSYEERVFETGEVQTRAESWHDFFNALVWLAFPCAKAALNARHYRALQVQRAAGRRERGPGRDAATQFDESGAVVVASDPSLFDSLRGHRWKELFWERRSAFLESVRVVVFGHATYDQLRAPFLGLCAKCVLVQVPPALIAGSASALVQRVDEQLARSLAYDNMLAKPSELQPLPLLGIPGVTPDSADPSYYEDARQFRPARMTTR